ncbi:CMRF35-like molecule 4 [Labeo rohita]|uniref:CMRF35-like molecule 4 n=1 Tax=Labeo rohita TaxID=84645 RepID=A0A498M298_LABRO|nr:CMRF35-like molecule 4 [Labeo rohita]
MSSFSNTPPHLSTSDMESQSTIITITDDHMSSTGVFVVIITVGGLVLLLICALLLIVAVRKKKQSCGKNERRKSAHTEAVDTDLDYINVEKRCESRSDLYRTGCQSHLSESHS